MGDNCILWFRGSPAGTYVHDVNGAGGVSSILAMAAGTLRRSDPSYAQARLTAAACAFVTPRVGSDFREFGVGLVEVGPHIEHVLAAGLGTIDPVTGHIVWSDGYLARSDCAPDRVELVGESRGDDDFLEGTVDSSPGVVDAVKALHALYYSDEFDFMNNVNDAERFHAAMGAVFNAAGITSSLIADGPSNEDVFKHLREGKMPPPQRAQDGSSNAMEGGAS